MIGLLQKFGFSSGRCVVCNSPFEGSSQGFLCNSCLADIRPYHPVDYTCSIDYLTSYRVFGLYEGAIKETIHCIKFFNSKKLALTLGERIKDHIWEYTDDIKPDLVTFPSLNIRRFWLRGFNHVEYILKGAGVPYIKVFERRDINPPLARLKKDKRPQAVMAHRLKSQVVDFLEGKRVLVVDDLLTTGSTIQRLAYLLLSVGADEVHAYFVAKVI